MQNTPIESESLDGGEEAGRGSSAAERGRLLDAMPYGVLGYDLQCRYTAWNPAMERIAGMPAERVLGRVAWEVFPFLREVGEDACFRAALAGEESVVSEQPFHVPESGHMGFFQARYAPVRDAGGRVVGGMAIVRDTTEARRAGEALQMQGRVLESMSEGVSVSDEEGFILYTNVAEDRMFGYDPGELVGQHVTVQNAYPAEENERLVSGVIAALKEHGVWAGEWRNRRKDGTPFTTFARITALELSGRHYWVCVQEDITERLRAEAERARLLEAEQRARHRAERSADRSRRLQAVAAALNEAVTPAEVARVCVEHGMAALEADAGSFSVLVDDGRSIEVVHSRGYPEELSDRWRRFPLQPGRLLSDAFLSRTPVVATTADGWDRLDPDAHAALARMGAVGFVALPVTTGGRSLAGLAFTFRSERSIDDSDRTFLDTLGEQAAQALERARLYEAERRARATAEQLQALTAALSEAMTSEEVGRAAMEKGVAALGAAAGVLALAAEGEEELEIVVSTGYPPEACMGPGRRWTLAAAIPIAEATRTGAAVFVGSPGEWGERYLGGYAPKGGTSAAWAALPVTLGGRTAGALLWTYAEPRSFHPDEGVLMQTVARQCSQALERARLLEAERSAHLEAEAARRAAEHANRAKTEFLSAMSHELRTPLNAIAGYVDLLDLGIRGPLTDTQRADLDRIKRAERVLMALINDVLNFARLEAGRIEYRSEPVALEPLLDGLRAIIEPQIDAQGLDYHSDPGEPGLLLLGDPERVQQILVNLLSNSIKFTDRGGSVAVRAAGDGDVVRIQVTDTGRGIPVEKLAVIFDPFVQVDRHRTEASQQGVGLGLAISRELACGMGGDLAADSEPGRGSRFTLTLPRQVA